jgi:ribonuclease HII
MLIVGVDEVGRGCLAGPVVAGAVLLPEKFRRRRGWLLKDSKLLTREQREVADQGIRSTALAIGLGWAGPDIIDEYGLTYAVRLAMQEAVRQITLEYEQLVIDGHYNFLNDNLKATTLIKADNKLPAVSAASIVAKVARDKYMMEMCTDYPHYGFEHNVGYGTPFHLKRLQLHGVSRLHRRSFEPVRSLLELTA